VNAFYDGHVTFAISWLITRKVLFFLVEILIARSLVFSSTGTFVILYTAFQSMPCTHACALSWHLQLSLERPSS
jgi:hypothetical protein